MRHADDKESLRRRQRITQRLMLGMAYGAGFLTGLFADVMYRSLQG